MRLPDMSHRTLVLGQTGTGKTVFSAWLLSQQPWDKYPFTIIDYKGDELLQDIVKDSRGKIKEIKPTDKPPKKPGLYIMRPDVETDDAAVTAYLYAVYRQENHGIFIDEGYAVPGGKNCKPLNAILTQGRARNSPVIVCYQRPVYMSRFAVAQASFIVHFEENDERDLMVVRQFMMPAFTPDGRKVDVFTQLPDHYCLYYDVSKRKTDILKPCPDPDSVRVIFRQRLGAKKGVLV